MNEQSRLPEYIDPLIYDAENAENEKFKTDGPFYVALAQQTSGSVLELGCGTGRIAILLAQAGIDVTGLDIVPQMLERARQKVAGLSLQFVEGDVRSFELGRKFDLICATGGVFNMLISQADQEAMLTQVRKHLTPEGIFAIDVVIPQPDWMGSNEIEELWDTYVTEDGRTIRFSGTDHYDPLHQIKHEAAHRRWLNSDGQEVAKSSSFAFRYIFPQEMEALLHYNGFSIRHRYGDGTFESPTKESQTIFYVSQKRDKLNFASS
ncbi:MAG: methyltransferase domain-containing protein [Chloroflexota bacterium]